MMRSCLTPVHFSSETLIQVVTDARTISVIAINGCIAIEAGSLFSYLKSEPFCSAEIPFVPINE